MKKSILLLLLGGMILLAGCQPTPEKSAVVSKSDGLSEESVAKSLKGNETKIIDIPQHLKVSEKRSSDRVSIEADLTLEEIEVGNLPVMEMKNHEMSVAELEALVEYFAKEEDLYQTQKDIKKDYENEIEAFKNREGAYGDLILNTIYQSRIDGLEEAAELAEEEENLKEIEEIVFSEKPEDKAWETAQAASLPEEDRDSILKKKKTAHFL